MEPIKKVKSMASSSTSSSRGYSHSKPPLFPKDKDYKPLPKKSSLDEATRQELQRKKLCISCKGLWEPRLKCLDKGKIQYIEVVSDDEDDQEDLPTEDNHSHEDTKMVSLNCTERIVVWYGA